MMYNYSVFLGPYATRALNADWERSETMIRKNQKFLNQLNVLSDGIVVLASYLFSSWLWLDVIKNHTVNLASISRGTVLAAVIYALWTALILGLFGVYNTTRTHRNKKELRSILAANAVALAGIAAMLFVFRLEDFSRGVLAVYYVTSSILLYVKRYVLRRILRRMRAKGFNLKHMLVIGSGDLARRYMESAKADKTLGINISDHLTPGPGFAELLEEKLHGDAVDEVIMALEPSELGATEEIIVICEKSGTKISVIPFYNDIIPTRPTIDVVGPMKLIRLRTTPLDEPFNAVLKRGFDIVASALMLIVASPIMLLTALLIKLSSPGPILFKQERVGYNKKIFTMLKFRSMRVNDREESGWSKNSDSRRTWIGSIIRKCSIDELPQLLNVLKGDMSLVGPRPEIPFFVEQFRETVPLYMVKNQVRPGITGWAQVNGLRGDTSIPERIRHDLWYIENWSFRLDIVILLRTVFGGMINQEKLGKAASEEEAA